MFTRYQSITVNGRHLEVGVKKNCPLDDYDFKENIKAIGLLSKTSTLHIHRTFLIHNLPPHGGRKPHTTTNFSPFFDLNLEPVLRIWPQEFEVWKNANSFYRWCFLYRHRIFWYFLVKLFFNFQKFWGGKAWAPPPLPLPVTTGLCKQNSMNCHQPLNEK